MRVLVVLLLSGAFAGCVSPSTWQEECSSDLAFLTPKVDGGYMQTAPDETWQTVILATGGSRDSIEHLAWSMSAGWNATSEAISKPEEPVFQIATVRPGEGKGNATFQFQVDPPGDCTAVTGSIAWHFSTPKLGVTATAGQGVHVMTAGFLENGTLFYTNIAEVDHDARWPRTEWYSWEGDAPLPVYVYDRDRAEQPAYWKPLSTQIPATGTPVDPTLQQVGMQADGATGLGYFTTIVGFNAALKELPTTTVHVARLSPEEAYTRPGNEAHPLYGESLIFLIRVLDVVDAPCPSEASAWICRPELPLRQGHASLG